MFLVNKIKERNTETEISLILNCQDIWMVKCWKIPIFSNYLLFSIFLIFYNKPILH